MFRTRDFILIFLTVAFLIVAIGATLLTQRSGGVLSTGSLKLAETTDQEFTAEVYVPETLSRAEKLADMRQKISQGEDSSISAPVPIIDEIEDEIVAEDNEDMVAVLQQCPNYIEFFLQWPVLEIQSEVVEGARLFYREVVLESDLDSVSTSSSAALPPIINKDVLIQLPTRTLPSPNVSCIASDVVGIAQDGSLIRNNEVGLYGIFGAGTLVGHALDGFPIYGLSGTKTDQCGGTVVNGQYVYFLSAERQTIINCFASSPVRI